MQLSPEFSGFVCIVLGLGFSTFLLWTLIRQHQSRRWPTTAGEILDSGLDEDSDGWGPRVRYAYIVKEKRYTSDRLYFYLSTQSSAKDARKHLSPYPVGKAVTVYYDPREPQQAVLDRRVPLWWSLFFVLFSAFWFVVGTGLLGDSAW